MKKKISMFLMVFTLIVGLTQQITLRTQYQSTHNLDSMISQKFTHNLNHYGQIPKTVIDSLVEFVKKDKIISQNIAQNKPLSKQSAQKIKNFLIQNKQFQDFSILVLTSKASKPDCFKTANQTLKKKLLKLILDEWDFTVIFMENKEDLNDPQIHHIVTKLQQEKDIKAQLDRCFAKYE